VNELRSGTRRHLALWFPFLSADRLRIQEPDRCAASPDAPLILFARTGNALRLAAVDSRAARLGLAPGLALADARARHPELLAVEHDPAADAHWLEKLARDAVRYAPTVILAPPDAITIDVTGAAHLHGGEAALQASAIARLEQLGMAVRAACGPSAEAAQALAHYGDPGADEHAALRALPVQALGLTHEATHGLQRAGLQTVGAVAARPMAALAARFGIEAVRAIERVLGREQAPGDPLLPPVRFRFERRFAEPVAHQDTIARTMLDLMHQAAAALQERALGGRRFAFKLCRSDGAVHRLAIETGTPTRDPAVVMRLFEERIGTLADPLDPGFGYDSLHLSVPRTDPLAAAQPALAAVGESEDRAGQAAVAALVDRLSTRLGPGRVRTLAPQDSHIPEQAQLALPAIRSPAPARWPPPPSPQEPPARPLFLFDPPQPVEVIAEVPDGPPHRFRWKRKLHEVRLYEGPERIAPEWWRRQGGEDAGKGGLTRDYYRVVDVRGRRFWIFRHGLYEEKPGPRWYMHGLFA
jgi:protein ImuB